MYLIKNEPPLKMGPNPPHSSIWHCIKYLHPDPINAQSSVKATSMLIRQLIRISVVIYIYYYTRLHVV